MKRSWIVATIILSAVMGIGTGVFFLISPKPIPKIKLSTFKSPEEVAQAIALRMNQEIKSQPVLLFGVDPQNDFDGKVAEALPQALQTFGIRFDKVLHGEFSASSFRKEVESLVSSGQRLLAVAPFQISSHMSEDWKGPYLSISLYPMPRTKQAEASSPLLGKCGAASEKDKDVSCVALGQARLNYRQHMSSGQRVGMMSQVGATDYLFLLGQEP